MITVKKILPLFLAVLLLAPTVLASDGIVIDPESGLEYRATLVGTDTEPEFTLHEASYSPFFEFSRPAIRSDHTETIRPLIHGDIFVSPDGNDSTGNGTFEKPYATFARAQSRVREMISLRTLPDGGLTVAFRAGTYQMKNGLDFSSSDSGSEFCPITYAAYGDGEVVFKSSLSLDADDFVPVSGKMLDYLTDEAEDHVLMIDLSEYGITPSDIPISSLDSGDNVTFFMDKVRFELAQYPNDGESILRSNGYDNKSSRAKLYLSDEDLERVKGWDTSNDIRALGMLNTDYNDSTSPVTIDKEAGTVLFRSANTNKWSQRMPFYFYNVPEELDAPGECWFDRENCILYVYPTGDVSDARLELNVGMDDTFIDGKGVKYVTFDGLSFIGSHGNGINLSNSDHITVKNCTFNNLDGTAVLGSGYHDTILNNEITYMGRGGIDWSGGEKATIKKSYDLIDNNLVEHWALNKRSFVVAINGSGQGVTISHNELGHSTSNALCCSGNLNAIEYNYVHDCVKLASDCGAFYNGSSWTSGSCDIRYNIFCNIGTDTNTPEAIFWDDGMAYQRAYGNLIMNVSGYGISIGGGFGNVVVNNVFLNTAWAPYLYDGRPYYGFKNTDDTFYKVGYGFIWNLYSSTPYTTTVWRENFPLLSQVLQNTRDTYAPHFGYNPAFSLFSDNISLNPKKQTAGIGVQHINYSTFIDNYVSNLSAADDVFVDPDSGDYRLKEDSPVWETVRDFERIPLELIGRY